MYCKCARAVQPTAQADEGLETRGIEWWRGEGTSMALAHRCGELSAGNLVGESCDWMGRKDSCDGLL
jgi:hypothetical protein